MCLGIPVRIVEISGEVGRSEFGGVQRDVSLKLLENVRVGDYVLVHAGFAIQTLNEEEAMETLRLLEEMGCVADA